MAKATKRQMLERREAIQAEIKAGRELSDFVKELAAAHKCSELSINRAYYVIINEMISINNESLGELKINLMARNNLIYKEAMSDSNLKVAMDAINLQAKMGGVYNKTAEAKEEQIAPKFVFEEQDNSTLTVVPDDDDSAANN